jgi:hypothetical protein
MNAIDDELLYCMDITDSHRQYNLSRFRCARSIRRFWFRLGFAVDSHSPHERGRHQASLDQIATRKVGGLAEVAHGAVLDGRVQLLGTLLGLQMRDANAVGHRVLGSECRGAHVDELHLAGPLRVDGRIIEPVHGLHEALLCGGRGES